MAKQTRVERIIAAPRELVFDAITDIEKFPEKSADIVKVEFLSSVKRGIGAKFRETRRMKNREASTVLECTEYVENELVRFVSDAGGTIWDSVYRLHSTGDGVTLMLEMEARPYKLLSKVMTPMIMGMVSKAVEDDMDAVKAYCETVAAR